MAAWIEAATITWKKVLTSRRFWKYATPALAVIVAALVSSYFIQFTTDYYNSTVLDHIFRRSVMNTQVFLHTIEAMKEISPEQEDLLLEAVRIRVERYDEEYSVNSLLVDADCNLVSERKITDPFCDPYTMPVDSYVMFDNVTSGNDSGYYNLHCPDADGNVHACYWYYQRIDLCGRKYFVLTGLQPVAVSAVIDVNRIRIPTFCLGIVVVISAWFGVYGWTRNWRDESARTRRGDIPIE